MTIDELQQKFLHYMEDQYKELFVNLRKACKGTGTDPKDLTVKVDLPSYLLTDYINGGRYLGIKVVFE